MKSPRIVVTTSVSGTGPVEARAAAMAASLCLEYVPRNRRSIDRLLDDCGAEHVIVVESNGSRLIGADRDLFFHPSMAAVRIKRLLSGEADPMIESCGLKAGDVFLDATLGFGSDSVVASFVTGPEGKTFGVEANPIIAALVSDGMSVYDQGSDELVKAVRRVEVMTGNHEDLFASMDDSSVDVVYFDPMFRTACRNSYHMEPLRLLALDSPLSWNAVREAFRVCRRRVVMKERAGCGEFERLGFTLAGSGNHDGRVAYGVLEKK